MNAKGEGVISSDNGVAMPDWRTLLRANSHMSDEDNFALKRLCFTLISAASVISDHLLWMKDAQAQTLVNDVGSGFLSSLTESRPNT
jgi:hypothetical protein